jgi:hypothetical protein
MFQHMERVEELTVVNASAARALDVLLASGNLERWVAPDIAVTPLTSASRLGPGDRFRIQVLGTFAFEYMIEAVSEREVVFSFSGPWSGSERWSFIADGAETIVRRVHEVHDGSLTGALAWSTVGRMAVMAHFKVELARFRELVEQEPGVRGEIESAGSPPREVEPTRAPEITSESRPEPNQRSNSKDGSSMGREPPPFPVDDG